MDQESERLRSAFVKVKRLIGSGTWGWQEAKAVLNDDDAFALFVNYPLQARRSEYYQDIFARFARVQPLTRFQIEYSLDSSANKPDFRQMYSCLQSALFTDPAFPTSFDVYIGKRVVYTCPPCPSELLYDCINHRELALDHPAALSRVIDIEDDELFVKWMRKCRFSVDMDRGRQLIEYSVWKAIESESERRLVATLDAIPDLWRFGLRQRAWTGPGIGTNTFFYQVLPKLLHKFAELRPDTYRTSGLPLPLCTECKRSGTSHLYMLVLPKFGTQLAWQLFGVANKSREHGEGVVEEYEVVRLDTRYFSELKHPRGLSRWLCPDVASAMDGEDHDLNIPEASGIGIGSDLHCLIFRFEYTIEVYEVSEVPLLKFTEQEAIDFFKTHEPLWALSQPTHYQSISIVTCYHDRPSFRRSMGLPGFSLKRKLEEDH